MSKTDIKIRLREGQSQTKGMRGIQLDRYTRAKGKKANSETEN
jgi:hypothetical protein